MSSLPDMVHHDPSFLTVVETLSKLVSALCELFEIKRFHTSSRLVNDNVERANRTLLQAIRSYISKDQGNWPKLLPSIMMAVDANPHKRLAGPGPTPTKG